MKAAAATSVGAAMRGVLINSLILLNIFREAVLLLCTKAFR
jgi:hypothetical protein